MRGQHIWIPKEALPLVGFHVFNFARLVIRDYSKENTTGSIICFFARKSIGFYARATYLDSKGSFPLVDSKGKAFSGF